MIFSLFCNHRKNFSHHLEIDVANQKLKLWQKKENNQLNTEIHKIMKKAFNYLLVCNFVQITQNLPKISRKNSNYFFSVISLAKSEKRTDNRLMFSVNFDSIVCFVRLFLRYYSSNCTIQ